MKFQAAALAALAASTAVAHEISLQTFQSILTSELDTHALEDALVAYDVEADFIGEMHSTGDDSAMSGYVVCNNAAKLSGYERRLQISRALDIPDDMVSMRSLYNKDERTCVLVAARHAAIHAYIKRSEAEASVRDVSQTPVVEPFLSIQPLTSYMKMRKGLVAHVEETSSDSSLHKQLSIDFCATLVDYDSIEDLAHELIHRVRNERDEHTGRSLVSQKFAWSSDDMHPHMRRHLGTVKAKQHSVARMHRRWSRALAQGLDADHRCDRMFDNIGLSSSFMDTNVFVDLGHGMEEDIASAGNRDCVLSLVAALSAQPEVCGISSNAMAKPLNDIAQWITQSGVQDERPFWDAGLTGKDVVVQVSDSGLDTNHCMFWDSSPGELRDGTAQPTRRKVVQYINYQDDGDYTDGHGTHVVGSILGNRSTDGTVANEDGGVLAGMAKDAKVSFFDLGAGTNCCSVPNNDSLFDGYSDVDAKFHSASWGNTQSSYSSFSAMFDEFAYAKDDFLPIIAAGNSGTGANTVGSPATAKNILSVGAGETSGRDLYATSGGMDYLAYFSSRGPTDDGRMKPDIVAPGHAILSAGARPSTTGECEGPSSSFPSVGGSSNYGVKYMSGTSMATPVTTGNAAIVRQYYMDGYNPIGQQSTEYALTNPSAAIIRATIYNGAAAMSGAKTSWSGSSSSPVSVYDFNIGFGRVNLITSLPLDGETDFTLDAYDRVSISNGESHSYTYDITSQCDTTDEISATLVWTDPASFSGCSSCVLNDLDIDMSINGLTYYPNGGTSADTKNNAERIRKGTSPGEVVQITVTGSNLDSSTQDYSLVVTGCFGAEGYPTRSPTKSPSPTVSFRPTVSPTKSPTNSPTIFCQDVPGWVDSYGDDCWWYEAYDEPGCPSYGDFWDGGYGTPNYGCCYCGGGVTESNPPAGSSTAAPSVSPTESDGDTCSPIIDTKTCNQTEGCAYNKFDSLCKAALSTEECSAFDGKKRKCKKNGCKYKKNSKLCKGRWD